MLGQSYLVHPYLLCPDNNYFLANICYSRGGICPAAKKPIYKYSISSNNKNRYPVLLRARNSQMVTADIVNSQYRYIRYIYSS